MDLFISKNVVFWIIRNYWKIGNCLHWKSDYSESNLALDYGLIPGPIQFETIESTAQNNFTDHSVYTAFSRLSNDFPYQLDRLNDAEC